MADPSALISSLVNVGSGIFGGLSTLSQQEKQNRIAQQQFNETMKFNRYTYEDAKKYNSAVAQVARLRQAGLNPALAFGSGNAGSVSAGTAPSSTAEMGVTDMSPFAAQVGASINQGLQAGLAESTIRKTEADALNAESRTKLNLIDALTRANENQMKIKSIGSNIELNRESARFAQQQSEFLQKSMVHRVKQEELKTRRLDLENEAQEINNAWLPATISQELSSKMAAAKAALISGRASYLQARAAMKQALTSESVMQALQGATPEEREMFWQQNMEYLFERAKTERANQFNLLDAKEHTEGGFATGKVSVDRVNNRATAYGDFDSNNPRWKKPQKVLKNGKWVNVK